ncbi:PorT family protein [Crocinitomicaceae bacterium]|nr:PorT family protein [Crocinitomicaceae bacterium]
MKLTIAILILTLFTWINGLSQENKFELGFGVFPNLAFAIQTNDGSIANEILVGYQGMEIAKPSISSNIFVEYRINKNSILGLGMGYQNNGSRTKKTDLVFGIDPITGNPISDPSFPTHARFVYTHHNIEIPLYYKYMFGDQFFVLIGTSSVINISNTQTSIQYFTDDSKEKNTEEDSSTEFRRYNFSGNIGFGLDYLNTDKLSLFVFPYLQYGFLGVSKSASLNRNFLSIGISTGIRF